MRYAVISLTQPRSERHPMHRFVVETDGYATTRLIGSSLGDGVHTALFHVEGWPPDQYEAALDDVPSIREYALSAQSNGTFSVYVREELGEHDRGLTEAFERVGLIALLPVVYRSNGEIVVRLVGPAATLQTAIEALPPDVGVDLREIGGYDTRRVGGRADLTDRQFEAVVAAVDCGYYENPRDGSVANVAERIGCAPSTAAEHLRRAERTVMRSYVEPSPFPEG